MTGRVEGKVAIIVGGGQPPGETIGNGRATAIALAREGARYKVAVNCICPGPTETPLLADTAENIQEALKKAIPMRRFGQPEEIANAILFFACEQSSYCTGQVLSVSGGLTMVG